MSALTRVYQTVATPLPSATWTPLTFGAERWDDDGMWVIGAPTRMTCTVAGLHIATGTVGLSTAAAGVAAVAVRINGATFISDDGMASGQSETTAMWKLAVGDYLQLCAYHNAGAGVTAVIAASHQGEFSVVRV